MELHDYLQQAPDSTALKARVDKLCKQRIFGESLTLSMLYAILESLEQYTVAGFEQDTRELRREILICEDYKAITKRRRAYNAQLFLDRMALPSPAKALVFSYLLPSPPAASSRHAPSKFTFIEHYVDPMGATWKWAPYSAEAWGESCSGIVTLFS